MLGVEDEVEVHAGDGLCARRLAREHVEEVGGVRQVLARRHRLQALADALVRRHDRRRLRRQALGLAQVRGLRHVLGVGVERGERRHARAQHVHRVRALVQANGLDDLGRDRAAAAQALVEGVQLLLHRQHAVDQEVADLFEAGLRRQVVDVVAAVEEDALLAVDEARLRAVEIDVLQALVQCLRYHDGALRGSCSAGNDSGGGLSPIEEYSIANPDHVRTGRASRPTRPRTGSDSRAPLGPRNWRLGEEMRRKRHSRRMRQ